MRKLLLVQLVAIGSSAIANAGTIKVGAPLISGDVSTFVGRQEAGRRDLSSKQLQGLTEWFRQHESGWQGMITEATNGPGYLHLHLKHSDGSVTSVSVIERSSGGHYLRVIGPGKWTYESFLGFWKSWAATRSLSDQDWVALESLISAT